MSRPAKSLAIVLVHGRGRFPEEMIDLIRRIDPDDAVWVAPAAPGASWYPRRFMEPGAREQPELDAALAQIGEAVQAFEREGFSRDRIAFVGFSQGACVASEYVYRHPGRWAGLVAFTGGLIGPEGTVWPRTGELGGTPVLLSSSEDDAWAPRARIEETARVFEAMGGAVTTNSYPGCDHIVSDAEIALARELLRKGR